MKYQIRLRLTTDRSVTMTAKTKDSLGVVQTVTERGRETKEFSWGLVYSVDQNVEKIKAVIAQVIKDNLGKKADDGRVDITLDVHDENGYRTVNQISLWAVVHYGEVTYRKQHFQGDSTELTKNLWYYLLDRVIRQGAFMGTQIPYDAKGDDSARDMDSEAFEQFMKLHWFFG